MKQLFTNPLSSLCGWNPGPVFGQLDPHLTADLLSVLVTAVVVGTLLIGFRARFRPETTRRTGRS